MLKLWQVSIEVNLDGTLNIESWQRKEDYTLEGNNYVRTDQFGFRSTIPTKAYSICMGNIVIKCITYKPTEEEYQSIVKELKTLLRDNIITNFRQELDLFTRKLSNL